MHDRRIQNPAALKRDHACPCASAKPGRGSAVDHFIHSMRTEPPPLPPALFFMRDNIQPR
jgi:hypothetical protein